MFCSIIINMPSFLERKYTLELHHHISNRDETVIKLGAYYCKESLPHQIFHDIHNLGCNAPSLVLLLESSGEVQVFFHEVQKYRAVALIHRHLQ